MCLELWMWVHKKCGISRIKKTLYLVESNECTYLAVHGNGGMNKQNNETYGLQYKSSKTMMNEL